MRYSYGAAFWHLSNKDVFLFKNWIESNDYGSSDDFLPNLALSWVSVLTTFCERFLLFSWLGDVDLLFFWHLNGSRIELSEKNFFSRKWRSPNSEGTVSFISLLISLIRFFSLFFYWFFLSFSHPTRKKQGRERKSKIK